MNNQAKALINNLINDLENKSRKLTDKKRHDNMMLFIKQLSEIEQSIISLEFEHYWQPIENKIKTLENVGLVSIQLPTCLDWKNKDKSVVVCDFRTSNSYLL